MSTEKITKRTVDAAKPRPTRYVVFDTVVLGFGLRVSPSGSKSWILEYRTAEGGRTAQKRRLTIAKVSDLSPDQARREAEKLRAQVKTGRDPQELRAAQRLAPTVEALAKSFIETHLAKRSAKTREEYERILQRQVLPRFASKKAKDLLGADIAHMHDELAVTPYAANRALAVISSMYSWASSPGAPRSVALPVGTNPARGLERFAELERGRVLSEAELERLGAAIRLAETDGVPWTINPEGKAKHVPKHNQRTPISPYAAAALRLLIFTGARLREVLNLRWEDFVQDRGLLLVHEHKTRRSSGAKALVLNAPALAILNDLPRIGHYIIAGDTAGLPNEKPRSDLKRPWELVRKQAGLEDLRIHDLRHNFGGFGAGGGAGLYIIGKLLGHSPKNPKTTARYSHLDNDPLRRASNIIGASLAKALGEGRVPPTTNVVPLPRVSGTRRNAPRSRSSDE